MLRYKLRLLGALAALALGLLDAAAAPRGFVTVSGLRFAVDGAPFRVAGVNNHYLTYGSDEEVRRVLDDAVALRANVVRIIVGPVLGSDDATSPTIWYWRSPKDSSNLGAHGVHMMSWDGQKGEMVVNGGRDGLGRLDFVLAEAGRRRLKVIVALLDFWGYMGGAQQMSAWHGGGADKYTFFARDPRTRADYREWARQVVGRVNGVTGVAYRDDPTVFSWELMNEPDIQPHALLMDWLGEMSAFVKSLDPNHLVSTGHGNMVNKLADLALPAVDFGTWHAYVDATIGVDDVTTRVADFCALGRKAGKPVLLEEFGLKAPEPRRVAVYSEWIEAVLRDRDCAGWVVWRLVARQDSGAFPDDHDGYDVKNDGGPLWSKLQALAQETNGAQEPGAGAAR